MPVHPHHRNVTRPGHAIRRSERELWHYEGLRVGSTSALRELLDAHHEGMHHLASTYLPITDPAAEETRQQLLRHAWSTAFGGLNMFAWHTTLRAWLFGILVGVGRAASTEPGPPPEGSLLTPAPAGTAHPGSAAQLPWTTWWTPGSWAWVQAWVASRPRDEREVMVLLDVLGWSTEEARDALGRTDVVVAQLHQRLHHDLAAVLSRELGLPAPEVLPGDGPLSDLGGLLAQMPLPAAADPPPQVMADFRRWRVERGLTLSRRLAGRVRRRQLRRHIGRAVLPTA